MSAAETEDILSKGTIHDLPTPLARACALALIPGLVVEFMNRPPVENLLAIYSLKRDERGVRYWTLVNDELTDDQKAEAIVFVTALVITGPDLSRWAREPDSVDDCPFVTISQTRVEPAGPGFGKLAVMMARECGIETPSSFLFFDPTDESGETLIP